MYRRVIIGFFVTTLGALAADINFDRDIRPILSDKCFTCHGPDEGKRMAGLRLDTKQGAFAKVIVPGDPERSPLWHRISAEKKSLRMPPAATGATLTDAQIQLVRQWIQQGARWTTHWSYTPPVRPDPPSVNSAWPRNAIDRFVFARLEREGLKPSPDADKVTLLRRVTYDLTGLPPTPAEVESFVADHSRDAYEKRVDRLLASPRYGERMAMQWLDLARYADTHGFHIDSHREMWPWRDWVINAFNRNMPFDQFTVEQLAGDLLPNPTREQKIATGFNRNHMINFEGGAIPEEYQTEYVVDRVDTTSTVWMGTTMACARCHDHKYDPIKQKDFYRFFAFFNTIPEKGLDGRAGNAEPFIQLPSPDQEPRLNALKHDIAEREKILEEKELAAKQADWEKTVHFTGGPGQGIVAHYEFDGHLADTSGLYRHGKTTAGTVTFGGGRVGQSVGFDGETELNLGNAVAFDRTGPFSIALWVNATEPKESVILHKLASAADRRGFEIGYDESLVLPGQKKGARLAVRLINEWPGNAIEIKTKDPVVQRVWSHITVAYDGSGHAAGLHLFIDGKPGEVETVHDSLSGSFRSSGDLTIGDKKTAKPFKGQVDDLRFYSRTLSNDEIHQLAVQLPVRSILAVDAAKRSKEQKGIVREYFLAYDAPANYRNAFAELTKLKEEKIQLDRIVPSTMVMQEMEKPRDTFVLIRGDYQNHGPKVTPAVPDSMPPLPKDAPPNRLGVARWLIDPSHPLTARVAVNRYWQMYFGTGIVETTEDFGSQGGAPSHPELLDWLATEFIRTGWNVKAIQRLIVTSATYRQSSKVTPALHEKDPQNRLLARGSRLRLPAEMIRDNALAVSGLLNEKIGGPSVFPYQPKGLWEELAFGDVFSAQSYTPGTGKDLYRRSMYTFWKRTSPPPALTTFDAPDREKCTSRRSRTNTPLQALVLLNDPTYVEAARAFAQRIITEGGRDPGSRITFAFRLATARKPAPKEIQVLRDLAEVEQTKFHRDPTAAGKLLSVGESPRNPKLEVTELAAWTTVASVILNLDEVITKE